MRWEGIEVFLAVVEENSFSAAAKRLGMSKSFVSRRVHDIENRLGVQLLNRTTRKLALTENGQAYFFRCKEVSEQLDEAENAIMEQHQTPRGSLKLSVAGAFGERYVAPAASEFIKQYPQIRIDLNFNNRNVDLVTEGYDLAIRAGVLKDSTLIARRIANRRLYICGAPAYFAHYGKPCSITDLKKHNCLQGSLPTWRFKEKNGHHADIKVEGNWQSNNGYALLEAAKNSIGLTQLPAFYVQDAIEAGVLCTAMDNYQPTDTGVWAVYPSNRHLSPKVRMFVEFLVERFTKIGYL